MYCVGKKRGEKKHWMLFCEETPGFDCYPCFYIQYFLNFSNRLNVNALIHLCPLHKASYCSFCQKATHKFDKAMVTTAGQPKD